MIGELARSRSQLVLVVHDENGGQELHVREHGAQAIQNANVKRAHAVAHLSQPCISAASSATFYGERKGQFAGNRYNHMLQHPACAERLFIWELERDIEGQHEVLRAHRPPPNAAGTVARPLRQR